MLARHLRVIPLVLLLMLLALPHTPRAEEGEDESLGKPAPAFELKDLDGNVVTLAGFRGQKVVWLNFWGLRCGPCVRELPALQKIYSTYKDQGLVIIGVNADGVEADFLRGQLEAREDLKAVGVTFPITPDPEFTMIDAYGLMGAPLNVFIDREGVVRYRHEGYEDGDEVQYVAVLEKLLAKK